MVIVFGWEKLAFLVQMYEKWESSSGLTCCLLPFNGSYACQPWPTRRSNTNKIRSFMESSQTSHFLEWVHRDLWRWLNWILYNVLFSYDQTISGSLEPTEKNENRPKFESTMKFVEDYLKTVVEQPNSFSDREQNKLTHEVKDEQKKTKLNLLKHFDIYLGR